MRQRPREEKVDAKIVLDSIVAVDIGVSGVVQGVGFRPHVYRLAQLLGLRGWVLNTAGGVAIRLEGPEETIERFSQELLGAPPPLASIERYTVARAQPEGFSTFSIQESAADGVTDIAIPPDIGSCDDCLREFNSESDRRYGYAFTNCVNCGPRFSITRAAPYDRRNTSMDAFAMCERCAAEYGDPGNRRFHAEPNACPVCGPKLLLADAQGRSLSEDELSLTYSQGRALTEDDLPFFEDEGERRPNHDTRFAARLRALLKKGYLPAIKGIGGYHLCCDAQNAGAVRRMRERKRRETKPFALLFRDLEAVREHCVVSADEEKALTSPARPIVLLRRGERSALCDEIAPGLDTLGVMLPYTPLQYGLFDDDLSVLVMTSANISGDPLILTEDEAYAELGEIADYFVTHGRAIVNRADDSVVMFFRGSFSADPNGDFHAGEYFIRRARGYVPRAVPLPRAVRPVLAVGGDLKSVFVYARREKAIPSQYFGDIDNLKNFGAYERGLRFFGEFLDIVPEKIVCDLHPAYVSAAHAERLALELAVPLVKVQHHKAHFASVMADNGLDEKVLGVVCDGTGYGDDGSVWGCEVFFGDYEDIERVGSLAPFRQPRGDEVAKNPLQMAAILLYSLWGDEDRVRTVLPESEAVLPFVKAQAGSANLSIMSSSCGRLFDAAAALCGFSGRVTYEGEAPMRMEALARSAPVCRPYAFSIDDGELLRLSWSFMGDMAEDKLRGASPAQLAARFHTTFVEALAAMIATLLRRYHAEKVVFSGGTFQNRLVMDILAGRLAERGVEAYFHRRLPANDGCLALGQVMLASAE
ncbi:MAG: carbamoyltransferase HypF [Actinobacteria bacterium]|nr:carbamoyltransferase HypF [Actinomycetota bacterium]